MPKRSGGFRDRPQGSVLFTGRFLLTVSNFRAGLCFRCRSLPAGQRALLPVAARCVLILRESLSDRRRESGWRRCLNGGNPVVPAGGPWRRIVSRPRSRGPGALSFRRCSQEGGGLSRAFSKISACHDAQFRSGWYYAEFVAGALPHPAPAPAGPGGRAASWKGAGYSLNLNIFPGSPPDGKNNLYPMFFSCKTLHVSSYLCKKFLGRDPFR